MNITATSLPARFAWRAGVAAAPGTGHRIDRFARAALRVVRAAVAARPAVRLRELAARLDRLQPALARELRAASRQGPMA